MAFYRTETIAKSEPDVELLEANVSVTGVYNVAEEGHGIHTFKSKTVEPDWLDTHMILADIKNLKYAGILGGSQKLLGGGFSWSINSEGYIVLSNAQDFDNWYASTGSPEWQTGGTIIADFYAVKKPSA